MAGTPIHDLGPEASRQYADAQKELDRGLLDTAKTVSLQTERDSIKPLSQSEMERFLETSTMRYQPHAMFPQFPHIEPSISNRCFKQSIAPSLGSIEKLELNERRIQDHDPEFSIPSEEISPEELSWLKEQQQAALADQKATLLSFTGTMKDLLKDFTTIAGFRNQFNRG